LKFLLGKPHTVIVINLQLSLGSGLQFELLFQSLSPSLTVTHS